VNDGNAGANAVEKSEGSPRRRRHRHRTLKWIRPAAEPPAAAFMGYCRPQEDRFYNDDQRQYHRMNSALILAFSLYL